MVYLISFLRCKLAIVVINTIFYPSYSCNCSAWFCVLFVFFVDLLVLGGCLAGGFMMILKWDGIKSSLVIDGPLLELLLVVGGIV